LVISRPGRDLEEQGQAFLDIARENQQWAQDNITYFLVFHKEERVNKGELAPGTVKNFCRAIKLFCDMHDLTTLNWKRITKVLPKSKSASNDRAPNAIQKLLSRALSEQGIRPHALPKGVRRYEWKGAHGFRKFFETRAAEAMPFVNVEFLMGHSLGLSESYYKPQEHDVLQHYLKAVDLLTINDDKSTLQKQVQELTEKSKEELYIHKDN